MNHHFDILLSRVMGWNQIAYEAWKDEQDFLLLRRSAQNLPHG